jgi:hypothetical protein
MDSSHNGTSVDHVIFCAPGGFGEHSRNCSTKEIVIANLIRLDYTFEIVKSLQTSKHGWKKGYNLLSSAGVGELKFAFNPPLAMVKGWVRSELTANRYYESSCTVSEVDHSLQAYTCVCEGIVFHLLSTLHFADN